GFRSAARLGNEAAQMALRRQRRSGRIQPSGGARDPARLLRRPGTVAEGRSQAHRPLRALAMDWWVWPVALLAVTFAMGVVAVLAGVGGGVLFVPIIGAFFPFHLDFVRAAGLLLALTAALSAAPSLLRSGLASVRLAMPLTVVSSITSIAGALLGLALPTNMLQVALGLAVLAIALLMWRSRGA